MSRIRPQRSTPYIAAMLVMALLQPAAAIDRSWTVLNGFWSNNGDWSPFGVPDAADTARIGNLLNVDNSQVILDQHDVVSGLQIENGMRLDTNTRTMTVNGDTTLSGFNTDGSNYYSGVNIHRGAGVYDLYSETMTITGGARAYLVNGGILNVSNGLDIDDGMIRGEGRIDLTKTGGTAMTLDGTLDAEGTGGILIRQLGSGRIDLDGATGDGIVDIRSSFSNSVPFLTILGDQLHDDFNGTMYLMNGAAANMNLTNDWRIAPGGELNFTGHVSVGGYGDLNGAHVSLAGNVNTTSQYSRGRINADATVESGAIVDVTNDSELRFNGETTIEAGQFNVGLNGVLEFTGDTTVDGGTFNTVSHLAPDGVIDFMGNTTWQGDVVANGLISQSGPAYVNAATTVNATAFDLDGRTGDGSWDVDHSMTVNANYIDAGNNSFDGTINVGGNLLSQLEVNLTGVDQAWAMFGEMNLAGNIAFDVVRLSGSRVNVFGDLTATSNVSTAAPMTFYSSSTISIPGNDHVLTLRDESHVISGATFSGNGTLGINHTGSLTLFHGADVNVAMRNQGRLRVGNGVGTATIEDLDQMASGAMEFHIDGVGLGEFSHLSSLGNLAIQGGELAIQTMAGYSDPVAAGTVDQFVLIAANFLAGEFDTVTYDATELDWEFTAADSYRSHEGDGLFRIVRYTLDEVQLTNYRALPGDANGDGAVDGQDYIIWNDYKFTAGTDWTTGDFNGDGSTDGADFILWNENKFTSVGSFDTVAVPEPSSWMLWLAAGLLSMRYWR